MLRRGGWHGEDVRAGWGGRCLWTPSAALLLRGRRRRKGAQSIFRGRSGIQHLGAAWSEPRLKTSKGRVRGDRATRQPRTLLPPSRSPAGILRSAALGATKPGVSDVFPWVVPGWAGVRGRSSPELKHQCFCVPLLSPCQDRLKLVISAVQVDRTLIPL